MNRFLFLFLGYFIPLGAGFSQGLDRCAEVVGSSGKYATRNGRTYYYTVGEPVILTLRGTQYKFTQGFHQPDLCKTVATHNVDVAAWGIEVFPNPTADFFTIRFDENKVAALRVTVTNLLAQTVLANQTLPPGGTTLDCSQWQPGIYLLRIYDAQTRTSGTVRFIKI